MLNKALLGVIEMNIHLWERKFETTLGQFDIKTPVQGKKYIPIMLGKRPGPYGNVDAAVGQFAKLSKWGGINLIAY